MSLAVPNQLNYREGILPVAIESRSNKRTFEAVNGTEFTPGGNSVIRFNINSDNLWDISHSYLQVKLTNMANATTTPARFTWSGRHWGKISARGRALSQPSP